MKILKLFLALCIFISSFPSCVTITKSFNDKLFSIEKGMPKEQVLSTLGKPDYRRFDNEFEEWEYSPNAFSEKVIIVTFENGKVSGLNSFAEKTQAQAQAQPQPPANNRPIAILPPVNRTIRVISDADFSLFYKSVKGKPFKDDQMSLIRDASVSNAVTCKQTKQLMDIFPFDDEKLKVIECLSNNIYDRQNSEQLIEALTFSTNQNKARALLRAGYSKEITN